VTTAGLSFLTGAEGAGTGEGTGAVATGAAEFIDDCSAVVEDTVDVSMAPFGRAAINQIAIMTSKAAPTTDPITVAGREGFCPGPMFGGPLSQQTGSLIPPRSEGAAPWLPVAPRTLHV
jgi:hypothetical protein